jgi:hypothetical protein
MFSYVSMGYFLSKKETIKTMEDIASHFNKKSNFVANFFFIAAPIIIPYSLIRLIMIKIKK